MQSSILMIRLHHPVTIQAEPSSRISTSSCSKMYKDYLLGDYCCRLRLRSNEACCYPTRIR